MKWLLLQHRRHQPLLYFTSLPQMCLLFMSYMGNNLKFHYMKCISQVCTIFEGILQGIPWNIVYINFLVYNFISDVLIVYHTEISLPYMVSYHNKQSLINNEYHPCINLVFFYILILIWIHMTCTITLTITVVTE